MLISTVACGGNLLMNVGQLHVAHFDSRALDALRVYGEWMNLHERSIRGCTQSEYEAPSGCRYTQNGNRLYVHVYAWPFKTLRLKGLRDKVEYAQLLNDASEIQFAGSGAEHGDVTDKNKDDQTLTLQLPL
jgi:alpha-L-fucosidase